MPCPARRTPPVAAAFAALSRLAALTLLTAYFPVLVGLGALVALTSPGPVFVKRIYRRQADGAQVLLYEFRTECGLSLRDTPVGLFLRRADLHRLPCLCNVLRGDVRAGERLSPARG